MIYRDIQPEEIKPGDRINYGGGGLHTVANVMPAAVNTLISY